MKIKYKTGTIKYIEEETYKIRNFIINRKINAQPGQYVMVWQPGLNEKPFSIVSDNPLMLSVASVGPFTQALHTLRVGDKITIRGPYGTPFILRGKKIILVGGGYGVVPLYFLAKSIIDLGVDMEVVIGAKTKNDLPFVSKFQKLGLNVKVSTDDGSAGYKGFASGVVNEILSNKKIDSIYTCGPLPMMIQIANISQKKGIFCQVSIEKNFKCGGMGICGECSYKGVLICKEGPVFLGSFLLDS